MYTDDGSGKVKGCWWQCMSGAEQTNRRDRVVEGDSGGGGCRQ